VGETEIKRRSKPADEHRHPLEQKPPRQNGDHKGKKTIRFYNRNQETKRRYPFYWVHYSTATEPESDMCLKALDEKNLIKLKQNSS